MAQVPPALWQADNQAEADQASLDSAAEAARTDYVNQEQVIADDQAQLPILQAEMNVAGKTADAHRIVVTNAWAAVERARNAHVDPQI